MTSSQAYSRPARLLQVASWAVALLFAFGLNMLGSLIIRDMAFAPGDGPPQYEQFIDSQQSELFRTRRSVLVRESDALSEKRANVSAGLERARRDYNDATQSFRNWLATRDVTGDSSQDPEVLTRTRKLDELLGAVQNWQKDQDALEGQQKALNEREERIDLQYAEFENQAAQQFGAAIQRYDLMVFAYRLAFTLPVLLLGVWLFIRFRQNRYWPFVHGFGLFALSAFFIELVPYLPSFGGYVRVLVGIALTVFAGVYILRAFQRYVERKRLEMKQSQSERAKVVAYDKAIGSFQKKLCPSCDKNWNLGGEHSSYCIHCGLKLFDTCQCGTRNFAFFPFCSACGASGQEKT